MRAHLNVVKKPCAKSGRYHHGALREAMIAAAEGLIEERGLQGFSLREAARRAGVSSGAPSYHFKDLRGLLTAVAAAAFERFGDALQAANHHPDLKERLRTMSVAYLKFALREREKFKLMWRIDLIDRGSPDYSAAVRRATGALMTAHSKRPDLAPADEMITDVSRRVGRLKHPAMEPAIAVWAMMHGFSMLAIDGVFGSENDPDRNPETILSGLLDRFKF